MVEISNSLSLWALVPMQVMARKTKQTTFDGYRLARNFRFCIFSIKE
jgi:hypothetical protein